MSQHSGHLPVDGDRTALRISGWLTGVYFVIELVIGLWSGSVAVISDAFHTFSAVGGVLIALVAQRLSDSNQQLPQFVQSDVVPPRGRVAQRRWVRGTDDLKITQRHVDVV